MKNQKFFQRRHPANAFAVRFVCPFDGSRIPDGFEGSVNDSGINYKQFGFSRKNPLPPETPPGEDEKSIDNPAML
jgi:hypothetical protein